MTRKILISFLIVLVAGVVTQTASATGLEDLKTFEVITLEPFEFSAGRDEAPPEIIEFARAAMQQNTHLHYATPGEGVLHLNCASTSCNRIRARVTVGQNGPVVWEVTRHYRLPPLWDLHFLPDNRKFARKIIDELAQDYEKASSMPLKR